MTLDDLLVYEHSTRIRVNYLKIPVTLFDTTDEGMKQFNDIYAWCLEQDWLKEICRTKSGGISVKIRNLSPSFDVRMINSVIELTLITIKGAWRFQFRPIPKWLEGEDKEMYGRQGFEKFKRVCKKHGIDLNNYKVTKEEGKQIKQTIEKPMIDCIPRYLNTTTEHVYHVDFHQSYPAGLVNTHPEFKPVIDECYKMRKEKGKEIYKAVLDYTIGFMQANFNPVLAHLSRDAIADNNRRLRELERAIVRTCKYQIVAHNTDGIWYRDVYGSGPFHGEGEGKGYGQWENDHLDCTIRFKSAGCYEYIEDGKYTPVVRGRTDYDHVKPREEWEWGAIYIRDCKPIKYKFVEGEGVKRL